MNVTTGIPQVHKATAVEQRVLFRAGFFILVLICGFLVFSLGVDYHTRFWTNSSGVYKIGVSVVFLAAMLALRRSTWGQPYWPIAAAFFAASLTNVVTWYLAAPLQRWLVQLVRIPTDTAQAIFVGKAVDVVLRLVPIFAVVWLTGRDLDSLYLRRGNWRWSVGLGVLALVNLLATAVAVAASSQGDLNLIRVFSDLPWWFGYSLMNAFMEEIWYRGLFMTPLQPVIGASGVLWATSLVFATSHLFAAYIDPSSAVVFGAIVLTLGLAWGLLMQKTKTIWGSVLYHTAADTFWFVAIGF